MRWNWSRCRPRASARIALITSPWLQASQTAFGPSLAFHSRTAATARACVCASPSPSGPGKTAADGCCCTTFQSGSLTSSLMVRPVQSPYRASPSRSSDCTSRSRPAATASAVCRQRSSGLLTSAASGTLASRSATACAWACPASSSCTPGVQPARTPPVFAVVRPCRRSTTVVTGPSLWGGRARTGVEDTGHDQRENHQPEDDAVDDERHEAAVGQVAQQPGDDREPHDEGEHGGQDRRAPDDLTAVDTTLERLVELVQPRAEHGGDGEQKGVTRSRRP